MLTQKWIGTAAFAAVCFSMTGAFGQTLKICDTNDVCKNLSGLQAKECYGKLLEEEDDRLNTTYQDLLREISTAFQDPKPIEDKLRQSQQKWIDYRDAYCDFRFAMAQGGTIGGLYVLDCKCTLTRDKADHLSDDQLGI